MVRILFLISFFILLKYILKLADEWGVFPNTIVEFAALAGIALICFVGLAKILTRHTEKGGEKNNDPQYIDERRDYYDAYHKR